MVYIEFRASTWENGVLAVMRGKENLLGDKEKRKLLREREDQVGMGVVTNRGSVAFVLLAGFFGILLFQCCYLDFLQTVQVAVFLCMCLND